MINFKQHLDEMSLRRPDGLKDALNGIDPGNFLWSASAKNSRQLIDIAQKAGWTVAGEGAYSKIFMHPKYDWCIKTFDDLAYNLWIDYCNKHKGNPYLPRFKGKQMFTNTGLSFIRVEKLVPFASHSAHEAFIHKMFGNSYNHKTDKPLWDIRKTFNTIKVSGEWNGNKIELDLDNGRTHNFNIMLRPSNNHPVIIDPWVAG